MAAIRRNRNDVADYLIDQLAVNVQHAADLREFHLRSRIPCRHRTFTCRDLAYEKGMMELVDLIDLTSEDVKPNIKRYLKARLQPRLDHIHQAYVKRLEQRKHHLFQSTHEREYEPLSFKSRSFVEQSMESLDPSLREKSIDETRKKTFRFSNYTLRFRLDETPTHNSHQHQQQSPLKTTLPTLSSASLFGSTSTPSFTNSKILHPTNTRQQATLPRISHRETKPYQSTPTGFPSDTRWIRN